MEKHRTSNSTERRQYFLLGGIAIIVGIFMWQACIERIELPRSSGWAIILLMECLSMNILALGLFALLVRLGYKVGLLVDDKNRLVKNRIAKLFLGLVSISGSVTAGLFLLSLQLKNIRIDQYIDQYKTADLLGTIIFFPFIAFAILLITILFQPLLNWMRSSSRTRTFVFATASLLALVPLTSMFTYRRGVPLFELGNSYDWFTSLRGPRIPPPNDLVVIDARMKNPFDFIKTCAACDPRKIIIVTDTGLISERALVKINAFAGSEAKILITSYIVRNVQTNLTYLQFAQMGQWPMMPITTMYGDDDSLTTPFFLARERNTLMGVTRLEKFKDEYEDLMYESYSKWGFVTNMHVRDDADGWGVTYHPLRAMYSDYHISKDYINSARSEWAAGGSILDSLKNKTVILDFFTQLAPMFYNVPQAGVHGEKIAAILMNIEQEDFIYRVPYNGIATLALFVLLVNLVSYYRLRPWPALGTAIILNALFFAGTLLIYAEWSILFYITPILYSVGVFTVIVFPYELVRERSLQFEERTRLATELKTARDMQFGLMPLENPTISGYDITGLCLPASEVGGDFYDYVWLDEEKSRLGIAVADVSGKAMKAAMTAVMTSGMIYREVGTNETPKNILRKINRPMYLKTDRRVFTALSFAVIDIKDKTLTFSNAGQMTPLLRRGNTLQSIKVEGTRLPLGVMENVDYNEITLKLQVDDVLILFTDGIVEAKNLKDELWGFERMEQAVRDLPKNISAKEMAEALAAEANLFAGAAQQHDDMTIVVVKVI